MMSAVSSYHHPSPALPCTGSKDSLCEPLDLRVPQKKVLSEMYPRSLTPVNIQAGQPRVTCKADDYYSLRINTGCLLPYTVEIPEMPSLMANFELLRKIGEGSFSSVYLARRRLGHCQDGRLYAVKVLIPTSHPSRIATEVWCLQNIGGFDNVTKLECCFREGNQVAIILPYLPTVKFMDFFNTMSVSETQHYFYNLLLALRRIHAFGVIHRDVKPSNFLYDRSRKRYMLIDFGLAERKPELSSNVGTPGVSRQKHRRSLSMCRCEGRGQVCHICLSRPKSVAPRAGTPGFRPPEVLLKCNQQGAAVDLWAVGVMLLSVLSGRYPFFRAPDDASALIEIVTLIGTEQMQQTALKLGKVLTCSENRCPLDLKKVCLALHKSGAESEANKAEGIGRVGEKCPGCFQNGEDRCLCLGDDKVLPDSDFPHSAYDLLVRLLDPNPNTRITAQQALEHPYITERPSLL